VLIPILFCLALVGIAFARSFNEERRKMVLQTGLVLLVILFLINAAYRFQRPALEPGDVAWMQTRSPENYSKWEKLFQYGSAVVPTYYLFGQYNVMLHNRDGHSASLLGQYSSMGWWYYFPVAFALKSTLLFVILTIAGILWALVQIIKNRDTRYLWLLVPVVLYGALAMSSHINIGVRHFLPEYPFFFIAAAVVLDVLLRSRLPRSLVIAIVVIVFAELGFEVVRTFPNYVPYMNQLASAHPKWWYLSDSNVEWGDDVRDLANYLHARGETDVRGALSGGWATLTQYGIVYHDILPRPEVQIPDTKYVAIGASFLNGSTISITSDEKGQSVSEDQRVNFLSTYRTMQPEAIIGDSIYVFRLH